MCAGASAVRGFEQRNPRRVLKVLLQPLTGDTPTYPSVDAALEALRDPAP